MPKDAPPPKIAGTRKLGAEIIFYDRYSEDRQAIAQEIVERTEATLIEPFDNAMVVAGQGTIGLELAADAKALGIVLDTVLTPCGGGGLVSGIALALSQSSPRTQVISVEPERFDGMRTSMAAGERTKAMGGSPSLADALMASIPGKIPFALAKDHLAGAIAVNDNDLKAAVSFAFQRLKLVVEPGGSAALAAALSGKFDLKNKTAAIVMTGANCDIATVAECCQAVPDP
jgi:threonine dehydratase